MASVLVSAGEPSGDAIGADFVRALARRRPDLEFAGLVGERMRAAGVRPLADQRALSVGGFVELLPSALEIRRTWQAMLAGVDECAPELVVLIDSGGFHLPLAKAIRKRSNARILYYVAPQVWAWRPRRLEKLASRTDRIAVVLPFEAEFYAQAGVPVDFVGHPILDREEGGRPDPDARRSARAQLGLDADRAWLGLFPGSRQNEIERHLELQLAAATKLAEQRPDLADLGLIVGVATEADRRLVDPILARSAGARSVRVERGGRALFDAIDAALAKPGTVTLELMLRERPMVVMGRTSSLSYALAKRQLRVPYLAMPNLIAGWAVVPECLQAEATSDRIASELAPLFGEAGGAVSEAARAQVEAFRRNRTALGDSGASERAAEIAEEMLGTVRKT